MGSPRALAGNSFARAKSPEDETLHRLNARGARPPGSYQVGTRGTFALGCRGASSRRADGEAGPEVSTAHAAVASAILVFRVVVWLRRPLHHPNHADLVAAQVALDQSMRVRTPHEPSSANQGDVGDLGRARYDLRRYKTSIGWSPFRIVYAMRNRSGCSKSGFRKRMWTGPSFSTNARPCSVIVGASPSNADSQRPSRT